MTGHPQHWGAPPADAAVLTRGPHFQRSYSLQAQEFDLGPALMCCILGHLLLNYIKLTNIKLSKLS